jgi:hypothetical protein
MLYGLVLLGKSTGHHVFICVLSLSTRGSGKFPWILLGSQDVRKNQMNSDLIWEIKAFYEFSTKCLRFEADPASETLQELQECDRRRVSGWRHTGKPFVFLVIKRSNIAFLKIIVFFWTSWTWWCCLCLDDPLYQPTVERPTRSTDITRDELVAPVPWSGESSDGTWEISRG